MSVLRSLAREHAVFTKLIARLEASVAGDEKTARRDVRSNLLVLLSALDKHEEMEDVVFGNPSYASGDEAKRILDQVEFHHQMIQELRVEFMEAANSSNDIPIQRLGFLVRRMADSLLTHFKTEEECLWPHYENFSRSLDASIRRRLDRGVKAFENGIAASNAAISQYLEARK